MAEKLNITVMLGGMGAEREVSLSSGMEVARALRSLGHRIHELDPCREDWELPATTEVVFLALHGIYGEDGTVQSVLEELGVCDTIPVKPQSGKIRVVSTAGLFAIAIRNALENKSINSLFLRSRMANRK